MNPEVAEHPWNHGLSLDEHEALMRQQESVDRWNAAVMGQPDKTRAAPTPMRPASVIKIPYKDRTCTQLEWRKVERIHLDRGGESVFVGSLDRSRHLYQKGIHFERHSYSGGLSFGLDELEAIKDRVNKVEFWCAEDGTDENVTYSITMRKIREHGRIEAGPVGKRLIVGFEHWTKRHA